ncbi:MAG: molybdopterin molybdotransferase MoeA [Acidobacteriota bacterium]|nr:molybdopterin molybdotransferase MoeA [Acidobacteriota bacterium]
MIPISEAKKIVKNETFSLQNESVQISNVVGRILAEDIFADMDLPPFDRSQMDGFAVRTEDVKDAPAKLKIVGESVAGGGWHNELNAGEAVRIMTGASVPVGADSVRQVELTSEVDGFITIEEATKIQQNVVKKGQEITKGEKVFEKGEIVSENMVATLASFGYENVQVGKRPIVAILATGSEIVDISEIPKQDQIRNSNSWMLKAFTEKYADVEILPIAVDNLEGLKETIKDAIKKCDCLIISGGVSVGDYDFTKPALRGIGAEIFFEKISLKPGKPMVFSKLDDTLIFGLPGNPVSIAVTFFVFVRMALLQMQSAKQTGLEKGYAKLTHDIKAVKGRDAMLPVSLSGNHNGELTIETLRFSGSSNFIRFAKANALVFVPQDKMLKKEDVAEIYFLP